MNHKSLCCYSETAQVFIYTWDKLHTASLNKANNNQPLEYALTLTNGFVESAGCTCTYSKNEFGRVHVNFAVKTNPLDNSIMYIKAIAVVPVGFRPLEKVVTAGVGSNHEGTQLSPIGVNVTPDGGVNVVVTGSPVAVVQGEISFQAGSS